MTFSNRAFDSVNEDLEVHSTPGSRPQRKPIKRRRKQGRCMIAIDIPEKENIEERKATKLVKRKLQPPSLSEEEIIVTNQGIQETKWKR